MSRLTIDFPDEEMTFLKMCCAKLGKTLKEFVSEAVIKRVEEWEDKWDEERVMRDYNENEETLPLESVMEELLENEHRTQEKSKETTFKNPSNRSSKNMHTHQTT